MVKEAAAFSPRQVAILKNLHGKLDLLQTLLKTFNEAATIAGEERLTKLPAKGSFGDFMNAMHAVVDQALSIGSQVTRQSDTAMAALESQFNKLDTNIDQVKAASQAIPDALGTVADAQTSRVPPISAIFFNELAKGSNQYAVDGNSIVWTYAPDAYVPRQEGQDTVALSQIDLSQAYVIQPGNSELYYHIFFSCRGTGCVQSVSKYYGRSTGDYLLVRCVSESDCEGFLEAVKRAAHYRPTPTPIRETQRVDPVAANPASRNEVAPSAASMANLQAPVNQLSAAVANAVSDSSRGQELSAAVNAILDAAARSPGPPGSTTSINCNPQCTASASNGPGSEPAKINVSVDTGNIAMNVSAAVSPGARQQIMYASCTRSCGVAVFADGKITVISSLSGNVTASSGLSVIEQQGASWLDPTTGLLWTVKDNGTDIGWKQAQNYCQAIRLEGKIGWRLPSIDELSGLFDPLVSREYTLRPNGYVFISHIRGGIQVNGRAWSATKNGSPWVATNPDEVWGFAFEVGFRQSFSTGYAGLRAICVRPSGRAK